MHYRLQISMLKNKIIVVTGAESGIGKATAAACADAGARIVAAGLDEARLQASVDELCARHGSGSAVAIKTDVRNDYQVKELFAQAVQQFGAIDATFANAGILGNRCSAVETSRWDWDDVMAVNLHGTFLTVIESARIMVRQGRPASIIATGSSSVLRTVPGFLAYAVSKGAVHTMMQALALELAPYRIRVNTLVPGTTVTDATRAVDGYLEVAAKALPMQECVEPEELGRLVAFAFSDALPHMTGTLLKVDAGRSIG